MVMPEFIKVYLITNKSETFSECHNKVLDIIDNILFNDPFVYIFITHSELFYIDEIKQVFIFEHL